MSNQWLNEMRRKMEDHTDDVPEGLWDNIKDDLFSEDDNDKNKSLPIIGNDLQAKDKNASTFTSKKLIYRISAVAAVVAMFFIGGKIFDFYNNEEGNSPKITSSKKEDKVESASHSSENKNFPKRGNYLIDSDLFMGDISSNNITSNTILAKNNLNKILNGHNEGFKNGINSSGNQNQNTTTDLINHNNQIVKQEDLIIDNNQSVNGIQEPLSQEEKEFKDKFESIQKQKIAKKQAKKPWMLNLLTGNTSGSSSEQFPGYATLSGSPMNVDDLFYATSEGNSLVQVLLANQNKEVEARIKHKVPVTLGVSMYYSLGKKWGIGTGINYTKLSSELRAGSDANLIKSDQSVHYIGVPVQVNYNVIKKGAFTGYVTAGAIVEKAVAGGVTTKYIVNNEVKEEKKEGLETKPVQFSVNSGVGLQLKIVNKIGIYAEPGIDYHFKDDSSLNTIYKEKPLNFNVKFGIRLLID
ncbi:outer membrane beta-barrel protein [Chryseobacterium limigenitum]|uniref:Outer membrane protein beta-barrel domain-containing protein n=1 Tax=Chryseobacterium limigenitum TaxID=1612149 RepID=A0A1K2IR54_9FLAO|nr:outer membrane beta-barrel protein [Chryseobacterium limigenitum]SFZ94940.1 Outer membrane protein beta-barrel domain-containing protein [Chryseobacterium limigenitum]